ncbi:MAG: prolyl oligopeptidase family serine peptidase [Armatimonadetes bacterium]|nr:prolyl oligopeptidase family serine peptidase [Armatimonadota bacterium]
MRRSRWLLAGFVFVLALGQSVGWQQAKKPLDHSVYDGWKSVRLPALSRDGQWLAFGVFPQVGDGVLYVKSTGGESEKQIARGSGQRFTKDGRFLLFTILPAKADVDQAKKDKKAPKDQPKNALGILELSTGKQTTLERVKAWKMATDDAGFIAYQLEEPPTPPAKPDEKKPEAGGEAKPPTQTPPAKQTEAAKPAEPIKQGEPAKPKKPEKKKDHPAGSELIVRNLATGEETKIADVVDYQFSEDGSTLVTTISSKTGETDGVVVHNLQKKDSVTAMKGMGHYTLVTLSKKGGKVAFLSDRDDYAADQPSYSVYLWAPHMKDAEQKVKEGNPAIQKGFWIPNRGSLRFSESGNRLFFPVAPKPEPEPKDKPAATDEEKAELDIWSWRDAPLMPVQLLRMAADRNKTYDALIFLDNGSIRQIEDEKSDSVTVGSKGDSDLGVTNSDDPYGVSASWDPGVVDSYLVNVRTGTKTQVRKGAKNGISLSPDSRYAVWFDGEAKAWFARDVRSGRVVNVTKDVPQPVHDVDDDHPDLPGPQGLGGWLKGDEGVLVYDQYDIWLCDPSGSRKPVCVTDGYGRNWEITLRVIDTNPDEDFLAPNAQLLLNGFDQRTKASGFLKDSLGVEERPVKLLWGKYAFTFSGKAKNANNVVYSRQTFSEYPDIWTSDLTFANGKRMSDANPQQKEYNWATSELVSWTSLDGIPLQGLLIKPEDFDPTKKYPMIVYFYERDSQNLFRYRSPSPSASTINPTMFASNGYLVFIPDIPYKIGYPGESCVNAVLPGVTNLLDRTYVDPKRIGVQGQSWGGYQIAYLVTRTNLFAAAGAGAAVSNMFSAYGGIRWGSGLVRQMQYEHGQSRIGGTPWEKPLRYMENSPIFWVDKVTTPLLLMNNDKDGAVPWYQGIEFFTALRRLSKPVWMLVYNNEDHNLTMRKNQKDLSVRLQQFFDHYLKGAPAPVWMAEGVPAVKKGKTFGLEMPPAGEKKAGG